MAKVPAAAVAAGGLVGGYAIARWTKKRPLGGVALAAAGSVAAYEWNRQAGPRAATALTTAYVAAFRRIAPAGQEARRLARRLHGGGHGRRRVMGGHPPRRLRSFFARPAEH